MTRLDNRETLRSRMVILRWVQETELDGGRTEPGEVSQSEAENSAKVPIISCQTRL